MAPQEHPSQVSAKDLVLKSLRGFSEGSSPILARHANTIGLRLRSNELAAAATGPGMDGSRNWMFDFGISIREQGTVRAEKPLRGVINVNLGKFTSAKPEVVESEMARTLFVAVQYDTVHFLIPLRYVYKKALEAHAEWLGDRPMVMLDPRSRVHEKIIRDILGDAVYHGDFGYDHWRMAVLQRIKQEALGGNNQYIISLLRSRATDPRMFFLARRMFGRDEKFDAVFDATKPEPVDDTPFEEKAKINATKAVDRMLKAQL